MFAAPGQKLTARQQQFVDHYVANGGQQGEAARRAGYAVGSADGIACKLIRLPHVQQAIATETMSQIGLSAVPALRTIRRLAEKAKSEYVQLTASADLLDRAGYRPPERVDHRLEGNLMVSFDISPPLGDGGGLKTGGEESGDRPRRGKARKKDLLELSFERIEEKPDEKGSVGSATGIVSGAGDD